MREYTLPPAAGIPDGKIKPYLAITEKETYGFYLYEDKKQIRFDLVISFDAKDRYQVYQGVVDKVKEMYPDYEIVASMDTDFSEE